MVCKSTIPSTFIWNPTVRKKFLVPCPIHSLIYLYLSGLRGSSYSLVVIICYSIFFLKLSLMLATGSPSSWLFAVSPLFFENFLIFLHHKMFWAYLVLFPAPVWNHLFLQALVHFFWRMIF